MWRLLGHHVRGSAWQSVPWPPPVSRAGQPTRGAASELPEPGSRARAHRGLRRHRRPHRWRWPGDQGAALADQALFTLAAGRAGRWNAMSPDPGWLATQTVAATPTSRIRATVLSLSGMSGLN